jgi:hypothetical protein
MTQTGRVAAHGAATGNLRSTLPTVPVSHPVVSICVETKHLSRKLEADADAKMAVSPPLADGKVTPYSSRRYKPWCHGWTNVEI